jgi:hypothetical protein
MEESKKRVGCPRNLENPEQLNELWEGYKKFVLDNPYIEQVVTSKGDVVTRMLRKPLLKQGFIPYCVKQGVGNIKDYLDNKYEEFSDVVTCIRGEWESDQIGGTMAGIYKAPNLTARLNGLVEKQENNVKIQDAAIIDWTKPSEGNEKSNKTH